MDSGGYPRKVLRQIAEHYPVALHGVSLSIGSTDPLQMGYLSRLKTLAEEVKAVWVSDHLCWTGTGGLNSHDLLPLPLHEASLQHLTTRIQQVQDFLGRPLVLENPSTYIEFRESTIWEPDFLRMLCERTGCKLLMDVNNIYVSSFNAGEDPVRRLKAMPFEHTTQFHLAGHQHCGTHIIDTHDQPVCDAVWELYRLAWQISGGRATLLEWDGAVPELSRVHAEARRSLDFRSGLFVEERVRGEEKEGERALSTPLDFMVGGVMENARMG